MIYGVAVCATPFAFGGFNQSEYCKIVVYEEGTCNYRHCYR